VKFTIQYRPVYTHNRHTVIPSTTSYRDYDTAVKCAATCAARDGSITSFEVRKEWHKLPPSYDEMLYDVVELDVG
jgi:hypothetical protein